MPIADNRSKTAASTGKGRRVVQTIESRRDWRAYFSSLGERAKRREFLRQVGRTIDGQPITEQQIELDVAAVRTALELNPRDCLLDLCCGNGAITHRLAASCGFTFGVDFSKYLIEIADGYHAAHNVKYIHIHAEKLTVEYLNNCQPTKICMLSSLQHFSVENLEDLIRTVGTLTGGNAPLFFSDIPDVNHLYDFYNTRERRLDYERRRASGTEAIGTWWSRRHLIDLFASHSYAAEMRDQHSGRANAHYRFDLLARPV